MPGQNQSGSRGFVLRLGVQVVQSRARALLAPGQVIVAIEESGLLGEDLVLARSLRDLLQYHAREKGRKNYFSR